MYRHVSLLHTKARVKSDDKILCCPFCGDADVQVCRLDEVFHAVECPCGARGPVRGTEDYDEEFGDDYAAAARRDAIASWNSAERTGRKTEP